MIRIRTIWNRWRAVPGRWSLAVLVRVLAIGLFLIPVTAHAEKSQGSIGHGASVDAAESRFLLPPGRPSNFRGRIVMRAFLTAYNRHDVQAVLTTLAPWYKHFFYSDCDYALMEGRVFRSGSRNDLTSWLRARFAEGDHFGGIRMVSRPSAPSAVGFLARRTSNVLQAQGLALPMGMPKAVLDSEGNRLRRVVIDDCPPSLAQRRPSGYRTRGLVQALLDAYNNQDVARILELMDDPQLTDQRLAYSDCVAPATHPFIVHDRASLSAWLDARFSVGDHLQRIGPILATTASASVRLQRTGRSLPGRRPITMTVRVDRLGQALQAITISGDTCRQP
ncbi:MAG TPA: hypothetical protein VF221_23035 [Chloroflexota bacterium]